MHQLVTPCVNKTSFDSEVKDRRKMDGETRIRTVTVKAATVRIVPSTDHLIVFARWRTVIPEPTLVCRPLKRYADGFNRFAD